jgi:hypothetical protein
MLVFSGQLPDFGSKADEKYRVSWKVIIKKTFSACFFLEGSPCKCYLIHPGIEEFRLQIKNSFLNLLIRGMERSLKTIVITDELIQIKIYQIRGHKVMLDEELQAYMKFLQNV